MNINSTFFSLSELRNHDECHPASSEPSGSKKTQIALVQAGNGECKGIN